MSQDESQADTERAARVVRLDDPDLVDEILTHAVRGTGAEKVPLPPEDSGARPPAPPEPDRGRRVGPPWRAVAEWGAVILLALVVALVIRGFFLQAFFIPSASMADTLEVDDRVLVNKLSYDFGDPSRGDIIVFERPDDGIDDGIDNLIKRVVGLEGERVAIRDNTLMIDGDPVEESYVDDSEDSPDFGPVTVPNDHVFVMGDNRDDSRDSRAFGPVPESEITGRAFIRIWPLTSLGFL